MQRHSFKAGKPFISLKLLQGQSDQMAAALLTLPALTTPLYPDTGANLTSNLFKRMKDLHISQMLGDQKDITHTLA